MKLMAWIESWWFSLIICYCALRGVLTKRPFEACSFVAQPTTSSGSLPWLDAAYHKESTVRNERKLMRRKDRGRRKLCLEAKDGKIKCLQRRLIQLGPCRAVPQVLSSWCHLEVRSEFSPWCVLSCSVFWLTTSCILAWKVGSDLFAHRMRKRNNEWFYHHTFHEFWPLSFHEFRVFFLHDNKTKLEISIKRT